MRYRCLHCDAGESVVCTGIFWWHGYTPKEGFKNAEQCLDDFSHDVAEYAKLRGIKWSDFNDQFRTRL